MIVSSHTRQKALFHASHEDDHRRNDESSTHEESYEDLRDKEMRAIHQELHSSTML
jgi:hypothetical protein